MSLVQLYLAKEEARSMIYTLGNTGHLQFRDLNPELSMFQRTFTLEIKELDHISRKVKNIMSYIKEGCIEIEPIPDHIITYKAIPRIILEDLSKNIIYHEETIVKTRNNIQSLQSRYKGLLEQREVILHVSQFLVQALENSVDTDFNDNVTAPLLENVTQQQATTSTDIPPDSLILGLISGIIDKEDVAILERTLWRSFRGNLLMNRKDVEVSKPHQELLTLKTSFIILAHGATVKQKIRKVCEALGATMVIVEGEFEARKNMLANLNTQIADLANVIENSLEAQLADLTYLAENVSIWNAYIKKEKSVYHVMNSLNYDKHRNSLIGEAWCPTKAVAQIQDILLDSTGRDGTLMPSILTIIPTKAVPPTFHKTNKFTAAYQSIIDSYGIASYQEINPGIFAIVTFPFLFAIMFGDAGHGFFLVLISLFLILNERRLSSKRGEIFELLFYGRFIILMMGIFSVYTGLIYNDIFSRSFQLFKSGWSIDKLGYARQVGVYAFGLDYNWHGAENALLFTNSIKMKMSIIIGVIHMSFSLILSYYNFKFWHSKRDIFTQFIPSFLFLQCLFGYLSCIIIYKWTVDWSKQATAAPALLNTFINMFLSPSKIDDQLYRGQKFIQMSLGIIAIICVPWLLLAKPLMVKFEKINNQGYLGLDQSLVENDEMSLAHEQFSDVLMHQIIHTIEFCLGCISHTASYLRLWALSLAHSQLSEVLWNMTLANALSYNGFFKPILVAIVGAFWLTLTLAVLVAMEGVSAMLHSLRLHWVESMSKHYIGGGHPYTPFSFRYILQEEED